MPHTVRWLAAVVAVAGLSACAPAPVPPVTDAAAAPQQIATATPSPANTSPAPDGPGNREEPDNPADPGGADEPGSQDTATAGPGAGQGARESTSSPFAGPADEYRRDGNTPHRGPGSATPSATATVDPKLKIIYLTFDDGPVEPYTRQILEVLAEHEARATFFVVGSMAVNQPKLIDAIVAGGHAIGNHSWSHASMLTLSDAQIRSELGRTAKQVGRQNMGACMRPPYGDRDDRVVRIGRQEGYATVLWDHWALDWEQPPVNRIVAELQRAPRQSVVLLHDGGGERTNTVAALRVMLPKWRERGYRFAPVRACSRPLA